MTHGRRRRCAAATREGFGIVLERLRAAGVVRVARRDGPLVEALEQAVGGARAVCAAITGGESRWVQRNLLDEHRNGCASRPSDPREGRGDGARRLPLRPPRPGQRPELPRARRPRRGGDHLRLSRVGTAPARRLAGRAARAASDRGSGVQYPEFDDGGRRAPGRGTGTGRPQDDALVTALARWLHETLGPVVAMSGRGPWPHPRPPALRPGAGEPGDG